MEITTAFIAIARDYNWYLDPVPKTWSEFPNSGHVTSENIPYFNHPGQYIEDQRFTDTATTGDAANNYDLYCDMLHEMGHMLGMTSGQSLYVSEVMDGDIDVTAPRPIPGLAWQSAGGHLTYMTETKALMWPKQGKGFRKWPRQGDVSCIAQIEGWWVGAWGSGGGGPAAPADLNPPH